MFMIFIHSTTQREAKERKNMYLIGQCHIHSKGHLKLTHRIKHVIPMVSFLDFPNTESFGEIPINDVVETERLGCHDARLTSMEKYSRVALLLFVCTIQEWKE